MRYPVDTRRLLYELRQRGADIVPVAATDEVRVSHRQLARAVRVKVTRRDAARVLVSALRALDRGGRVGPTKGSSQESGNCATPQVGLPRRR